MYFVIIYLGGGEAFEVKGGEGFGADGNGDVKPIEVGNRADLEENAVGMDIAHVADVAGVLLNIVPIAGSLMDFELMEFEIEQIVIGRPLEAALPHGEGATKLRGGDDLIAIDLKDHVAAEGGGAPPSLQEKGLPEDGEDHEKEISESDRAPHDLFLFLLVISLSVNGLWMRSQDRNRDVGRMILSSFFYSLQYLDVKRMNMFFNPWLIGFFRGGGGMIIALLLIIIYRVRPILGRARGALFVRGMLGGAGLLSSFVALRRLELSMMIVLLSTAPFWMAILARMRGDRDAWRRSDTAAAILCFVPLCLLIRSSIDDETIGYMLLGLGSAILQGAVNLAIHEMQEDGMVISLYSMALCAAFSAPGMFLRSEEWEEMRGWRMAQLCGTGVLSLTAQALKTYAIQGSGTVGLVILRYLDVPFCMVWDAVILGVRLSWREYLCIGWIGIACLMHRTLFLKMNLEISPERRNYHHGHCHTFTGEEIPRIDTTAIATITAISSVSSSIHYGDNRGDGDSGLERIDRYRGEEETDDSPKEAAIVCDPEDRKISSK